MKGLHVASLDWRIIEPWVPFDVAGTGIIVVPLPLVHGPPEPMLGFEFSSVVPPTAATSAALSVLASSVSAAPASSSAPTADRIVYMSDLVALPGE